MTPLFLICPPRAKGSLLLRMLNATPGIQMAGESDDLLRGIRTLQRAREKVDASAAGETWPRHFQPGPADRWQREVQEMLYRWCWTSTEASHSGVRSSFLGREGWEQACDWWSWLLEAWPEARLIFLTRDQGEIELSMLSTSELWMPAYGKCVGCVGGRVHGFLQSMRDFHVMNPGRTTLLDAADLGDFATTAGALERIGVPLSREGWERELSQVKGSWRELRALRPVPEDEHPLFRPGVTTEDFLAYEEPDGPPAVEESRAASLSGSGDAAQVVDVTGTDDDPFLEKIPEIPVTYRSSKPRSFVEFPAWHARAIVYPWLSTAAAWEELRYSLRSIERHFADRDCPIYIIGDAPPPWLQPGGRVRFIPVDYSSRRQPRDKGLWQARRLGLQLADRLLWMMDDLFLLRDCSWADFEVPFAEGSLVSKPRRNAWIRGKEQVRRDLLRAGFENPVCYSSHAPRVYEREAMLEVLKRFHVPFTGGLENLYFNIHPRGRRDTAGSKARGIPASPGALWANLNDDRETLSREPLMALFPEPAPWEIPGAEPDLSVPRIIHQTWAATDYPRERYPQAWQDSWREHHPDWEYRFWTDADILDLARQHYPEFLPVLEKARGIIRSDLGRLLIVHRFGGLYVDLDYQCLKPMDGLLQGAEVFVSSFERRDRTYIHNALFAGRAGHPMFLALATRGMERARRNLNGPVEWLTGPEVFTESAPEWQPVHLPEALVCPVDWLLPRRDWIHTMKDPALHFPDAHAVTWWKHGWK